VAPKPEPIAQHPHFGFTAQGLEVHLRTIDYHDVNQAYARVNSKLALWITRHVGTMTCFWAFSVLALLSLPATLKEAHVHVNFLYGAIPAFFLTFGFIYLITWICQNYIQLVLLPALMVGQNLQNQASDARSAKSFEDLQKAKSDISVALDLLDTKTQGGLKEVLDAVHALNLGSKM
jgi:hypothetical protein